ncbi:hypothetical protein F5887DRAFT_1068342 [Amanita rubescens]|nr:hypothetical protein F5887DRAFT_1068342 [Amanita rubescens]
MSARWSDVVKVRDTTASPAPVMSQVSQMRITAPPRAEAPQNPSQAPQLHRGQSWSQVRRPGPAFETPLPALYQTEVPVSMAKIIMSRHTYRKPTPRPPSRSPSPTPQMQISKRPPSLV